MLEMRSESIQILTFSSDTDNFRNWSIWAHLTQGIFPDNIFCEFKVRLIMLIPGLMTHLALLDWLQSFGMMKVTRA